MYAFECSVFAVWVAQYEESPGSLQPNGIHTLGTKSVGLTMLPAKKFGNEGGFTSASSMLPSFMSHVRYVYAANCLDRR